MTSQLFRQEAIDALARTQLGEVRLGIPIRLAHAILTLLILLLVATWHIGGSSYTRKYPLLVHAHKCKHHDLDVYRGHIVQATDTENTQ